MTSAEVAPLTVPLEQVPDRLSEVLAEHGVAVVTGCASEAELRRLEKLFTQDLHQLLVPIVGEKRASCTLPKPTEVNGAADAAVRCAGITQEGKRCSVTSAQTGRLAKHAASLQQGGCHCLMHAGSPDPPRRPRDSCECLSRPLCEWSREALAAVAAGDRCAMRGLSHGTFAWGCRLLAGVRRCYETLHAASQTDLAVGLDHPFFAANAAGQQTNPEWPHVDLSTGSESREDSNGLPFTEWQVYQSLLYIWPSTGAASSTTVVWPGSHKDIFTMLMADPKVKNKRSHYVQLTELSPDRKHILLAQWRVHARRVPVPAGALLLWSSRIVHQGWRGGPRLAQPVCWEPKVRRDDGALERKLRLCALGLPSTHWSSLGVPSPHGGIRSAQRPWLAPEVEVGVGGESFVLRSTIEPFPLRNDCTAREAWGKFGETSFARPRGMGNNKITSRQASGEMKERVPTSSRASHNIKKQRVVDN